MSYLKCKDEAYPLVILNHFLKVNKNHHKWVRAASRKHNPSQEMITNVLVEMGGRPAESGELYYKQNLVRGSSKVIDVWAPGWLRWLRV